MTSRWCFFIALHSVMSVFCKIYPLGFSVSAVIPSNYASNNDVSFTYEERKIQK